MDWTLSRFLKCENSIAKNEKLFVNLEEQTENYNKKNYKRK